MLVKKGRLELRIAVDDLVSHCEGLPFFKFVSISPRIAIKSVRLEPFHSDPADRMIVATTQHFGGVLVTKDQRLQGFPHVDTIW